MTAPRPTLARRLAATTALATTTALAAALTLAAAPQKAGEPSASLRLERVCPRAAISPQPS